MAGTKAGGQAAAATNKAKYGDDFYAKIGAVGGRLGTTGGFAAGEAGRRRARVYGHFGGKKSRRGPGKDKVMATLATPLAVKTKRLNGYYKPVVSIIPPHKTFYVYIANKEE
jgi:hypothetical protein